MRIGVVTTSYPREASDPAGGFVAGLSRWLAQAGARVEIVAAGPGAARDGAIPIHRIDAPALFYGGGAPEALAISWRARLGVPGFFLRMAAQVARRAARWDLLISHWLVPSGLAAVLLGRSRPHVAIAHSSDVHLLGRLPAGALVARKLARALAQPEGRLIFVSDELRRRFWRLARMEVGTVVPMGLADRAAAPPTAPPAGRFTVLFLGRLVPIKGVLLLLRAAQALPEVAFVIAGEGPDGATLRQQAPKNVRFEGELRGPAKQEALANAHLVCIPSVTLPDGRCEGAPTVVVEAFAAGRPVVATATGGLPETVAGAGLLLPEGDVTALAQAILRLAKEPSLYATLAAEATRRAALYDWSELGPRILGPLAQNLPISK